MGCECDAVEVGGRREREAGGSNSCPIGIRWLMSGGDGGSVVAGPTRRSVCVPLPSHPSHPASCSRWGQAWSTAG